MTFGVPTQSSDAEFQVSLGKVVRELRDHRKLTQAELARFSGTNISRIGQLERGESRPSDESLEKIARTLDVEVAELLRLAAETYQQRVELKNLLEHLAIPRENWVEFLSLEPSVRKPLIESLRAQLPARAGILRQIGEIADTIERDGVEASAEKLLEAILLNGLAPLDYLRSSVQMEEMPGERIIFADRLPMSPATVPIDELFLFRASYGIDPSNPKVLKWWADARRTAVVATLKEFGSRTIIPIEHVVRYIRTGERGPNIVLPPDVVLAHLVAIIDLLRKNPNFMIGLSDTQFPVAYRIKGDRHVIASVAGYVLGPNPQESKMTLRFSHVAVAEQFRQHFETVWQGIPDQRKDSASVANWLERQLPNVGQGKG